MLKEITATGKDITEAKENARAALGAGLLDEVNFEIIDLGSKGIFGIIGVKPAKVKASIEIPDAPERRPDRPKREDRPQKEQKPHDAREPRNNEKKPQNNAQKPPKAKKPAEKPEQPKNEKPKSAVIPEKDLIMEKKEVEDGMDVSFDFVKTLLKNVGLSAQAELFTCNDGTRRINIVGEDASALIGHHGDTLDALQYLANLASAQKNANGERDKSRVTVDIEGYRAKREETLRALARRMAAKALRNKRSVMLEPMSAYERRIIHSEIHNIEGVSTNSIGSDNNRKIVIFLTDKKPVGIFDDEETVTPLQDEFAKEQSEFSVNEMMDQSVIADSSENEVVSIEKEIKSDDNE